MFPDDSNPAQTAENLRVLDAGADDAKYAFENDAEFRNTFEEELRTLAEEIVQSHPSLTQLLLSMSQPEMNPVHGKN
ncbi:hypothetical protein OAL55_00125 [Verrucomicrobiales bacterium]|jgi:hypothetical protein|nr:hypothetical protein [Verrucomicrobiales bacterium]MDC0321745.1 hypothetical protein [Verrucomicrobiales bacterium]